MEALIYKYITDLRSTTKWLRKISTITLVNVIFFLILFISIVFQLPVDKYNFNKITPFLYLGIASSIIGIILLYLYSKRKDRATIIYEELTILHEDYLNSDSNPKKYLDKVERPHHNSGYEEKKEFEEMKQLFESRSNVHYETKVAIKNFLKTTDLPFTKGKIGESFYLMLYILFIVVLGYMQMKYAS